MKKKEYNDFHRIIHLAIEMKEFIQNQNVLSKEYRYQKKRKLIKETNEWLADHYYENGINKRKEKKLLG